MQTTLLAFMMLIAFNNNAQSIILKGGYSHANMTTESDRSYDAINGFHAGLMYDHRINDVLSLESGLMYMMKGRAQNTSVAGYDLLHMNTKLGYLQLPLNVKLGYNVNEATRLYAAFGPYAALGLHGTQTRTTDVMGYQGSVKSDIAFGNDATDTKMFDAGINLGIGAELSNMILELSYNHGLANTDNVTDNSMHHRVINLSAGYKF